MDPTKLVIKQIVPTFMCLDSFMESSIFNLEKNQEAGGGFDYKNEGKLAIGVGREDVSGVFPLFLFREHWEIAKRKIQGLFGFMCTLDPTGYASAQYMTIPFLVLQKALENMNEEDTENNRKIYNLIKETCEMMVTSNLTLRENTIT
jgi:hypothetical protein